MGKPDYNIIASYSGWEIFGWDNRAGGTELYNPKEDKWESEEECKQACTDNPAFISRSTPETKYCGLSDRIRDGSALAKLALKDSKLK